MSPEAPPTTEPAPSLLPALAAALAPAQVPLLSRRFADPDSAAQALRLARLPRGHRLEALEAALRRPLLTGGEAAAWRADAERPPLAALLRAGPAAARTCGLLARLLAQAGAPRG